MIRTLDPDEVVILAPAHRDAAAFDATHPYRVVRSRHAVLWPTADLRRQAQALIERHDLQLVQLGHPLPAGLLGPMLRRRTGREYLVFLGGAEVTLPAAFPLAGGLLRHVLRNAALLVTVSEFTAAAATRIARGRTPAQVVRPALDVQAYGPPEDAEVAAARAQLGVNAELIVCLGRLVPRKGQDKLVAALAMLGDEFPRAELTLIGSGRLARGRRAPPRRPGGAKRRQLNGALPDDHVRLWLRAADVFASPCRSRWGGLEVEGYGLVFAEAALMGLPVVVGRSGGAPEAVIDGRSGIVVDGRSTTEVAQALARLLRLSPSQRRQMGERGRELALARHDPAAAGRRYREVLSELGRRRKAGER
jgi:phosphatidylinositol alpha-1,6-mannosyltransferase